MTYREFMVLLLVCLIWGLHFIVMKLTVGYTADPLFYAAVRMSLGRNNHVTVVKVARQTDEANFRRGFRLWSPKLCFYVSSFKVHHSINSCGYDRTVCAFFHNTIHDNF